MTAPIRTVQDFFGRMARRGTRADLQDAVRARTDRVFPLAEPTPEAARFHLTASIREAGRTPSKPLCAFPRQGHFAPATSVGSAGRKADGRLQDRLGKNADTMAIRISRYLSATIPSPSTAFAGDDPRCGPTAEMWGIPYAFRPGSRRRDEVCHAMLSSRGSVDRVPRPSCGSGPVANPEYRPPRTCKRFHPAKTLPIDPSKSG